MHAIRRLILFCLCSVMLFSGCTQAGSTPVVQTVVVEPAVESFENPLSAQFSGLSPDAFLEAAYEALILREPELVTELGLSDVYGVRNDRLNDLSSDYRAETHDLVLNLLDLVQDYDQELLPADQRLAFEVFEWYLKGRIEDHAFFWHDYPLTHMFGGIDDHYYYLFNELHPMDDTQDVEDFLARLWAVGPQLTQIVENIDYQIALGVFLPQSLYNVVMSDLNTARWYAAKGTPFYGIFVERLAGISGIDEETRAVFLEEAEAAIAESVMPGFEDLITLMQESWSEATVEDGAWKLPDGEAYYAYRLKKMTTLEMTADEIHALGLQEVSRVQDEIFAAAADLGYSEDLSIPEIFQKAAADGGFATDDEIVGTYEALIDAMRLRLPDYFDVMPEAPLEVRGVPQGGYYAPPPLDGSRPGVFFATDAGVAPLYDMASLAYHEAIPGHHMQLAIAQELGLPGCQSILGFTGYIEGWALYAERLAWEMGAYDNDPYGNLGRLKYELLRAARLVVDTGLHAKKWDFEKAVDYLVDEAGQSKGYAQFAALRYIAWPGQATAYQLGMLAILSLRQGMMDTMGDDFDITAFHNIVLGHGALPLPLLEKRITESEAAYGTE